MRDTEDVEQLSSLSDNNDTFTTIDRQDTYKSIDEKIDPLNLQIEIESSTFFDNRNYISNIADNINIKDFGNNKNGRRVRFATFREVRSFPEKIQKDAKIARLSYKPPIIQWSCDCYYKHNSLAFIYSVYLAPLV